MLFSLLLVFLIACTQVCVYKHPDQRNLLVPQRDQLAVGSVGPLGSSKCRGLWAACSRNSHSAGVIGTALQPCPREKSHLRNRVISAITEGFDKLIPRVSTLS